MAKKKTAGSESQPAPSSPTSRRRAAASPAPSTPANIGEAVSAPPPAEIGPLGGNDTLSAASTAPDLDRGDTSLPDVTAPDLDRGGTMGGDGASVSPTYEQIAEAAYHRYLQRGGTDGRDFDDWVEAERELRSRK